MIMHSTSHVRKADVVRLSGHVEELIYGKFKMRSKGKTNDRPTTDASTIDKTINHKPKGFEYLIARFAIDKTIEKVNTSTNPRFDIAMKPPLVTKASVVTLKGNLPYHSRYFDYTLSCIKKWDPLYNQEYYQVLSVVEVKVSSLTLNTWICHWIVCVENDGDVQFLMSTVSKYTGRPMFNATNIPKPSRPNKLMEVDVNKFPDHPFSSVMYPKSEHYNWMQGKPLYALIPRDADVVTSDTLASVYVDRILKTAADPNASWKLMTKAGRRSIFPHFKHKPSLSWHVVPPDAVTPVIEGEDEREGAFRTETSIPTFVVSEKYARSLSVYKKMKKRYRNRLCSTSFILNQFLTPGGGESDMTTLFKTVLCDEMQLLVHETTYGGQEMFTFKRDFDVQTKIIDFYKRLWARERDVPELNDDYRMDKRLSTDQRRALNSVKTLPMVNVIAPPGRGKSFLIAEIAKKYENVAVVTHVASLAAKLREKVPSVITICSSIAKNDYDERKRLLEATGDEEEDEENGRIVGCLFGHVEVLVVDEAEDVENIQMEKLYAVFKNVSRVVHVYDPQQILPIGPGNLALNLQEVMRGTPHNVVLTEAFRFGWPGIESNVARNDELLLKRKVNEMISHSFPLKIPVENVVYDPLDTMPADDRKDLVFLLPVDNRDVDGVVGLKSNLIILDKTIEGFFSTEHSLTCISLTNRFKDTINAFVEKKRNPKGHLFYALQRITIVGENYERKRLDRLDVAKIARQKREERIRKQKRREQGLPDVVEESGVIEDENGVADESAFLFSHAVKNGESYIVACIKDYSVVTKTWVEGSETLGTFVSDVEGYDKANLRRCLITATGEIICVHPDYVPHEKIKPGWAITVDRAKGLEYDNVLFTFDATRDRLFPINHLHVALTRARCVTYVMNTKEAFRKLAMTPTKQRFDLMEWRLSRWFDTVRKPNDDNVVVVDAIPVLDVRTRRTLQDKRTRSTTEKDATETNHHVLYQQKRAKHGNNVP